MIAHCVLVSETRNIPCRTDDVRLALALEAMADSLAKSFGAQADRSKAMERARLALHVS